MKCSVCDGYGKYSQKPAPEEPQDDCWKCLGEGRVCDSCGDAVAARLVVLSPLDYCEACREEDGNEGW